MLPSPDDSPKSGVERQTQISKGIVALATAQLAPVWAAIDWSHPNAQDAVRLLYGGVVTKFGQSSAAVAAMFYDELRADADVSGSFRAAPAAPIAQAQMDKIVASAWLGSPAAPPPTTPAPPEPAAVPASTPSLAPQPPAEPDESDLTTSDLELPERVQQRLDGSLQRLVLQPGRDTMAQNADKDPARPKWARVTVSEKPCAFCIAMASRPFDRMYSSEQSALYRSDGEKYHNHCWCEAIPVFSEDSLPSKMTDHFEMYDKAAADAGSRTSLKPILASMRQLYGVS